MDLEDKKEKNNVLVWGRFLLIVLLVIGAGLLAINQTLEYFYRAEFLKAPCSLCLELNPEVARQCFIREDKLFPNGQGGWAFENGTSYDGYSDSRNPSLNLSKVTFD